MVIGDDFETKELIMKWFERAQIDYSDLYARLYIAYNAWFRRVTQTPFDREGIARLKKRFVIWDDYFHGRTMVTLTPYFEQIVQVTHQQPLVTQTSHWGGVVETTQDWQGLIQFWYQVRCDLFHGHTAPNYALYTKLAYQSLDCFMLEITKRMSRSFSQYDQTRLLELEALLKGGVVNRNELEIAKQSLQDKFIHSIDLWNVDMIRYEKGL